jgi:hypothetical protein
MEELIPPTTIAGTEDKNPVKTKKKDRRIQFLLERCLGIPNVNYLENQTLDVRQHLLPEEVLIAHDDFYGEMKLLHDSVFNNKYVDELKSFRRELRVYSRAPDASERQFYINLATWSAPEALCLWLGSVPNENVDLVAWAEKNKRLANFAAEVLSRWKFIERAIEISRIKFYNTPAYFASWAINTGLLVPELFHDVIKGVTIVKNPTVEMDELHNKINSLEKEIYRLNCDLKICNELHQKEYKEFFGALCLGVYGFDPNKRNMHATPRLRDAIRIHFDKRDNKTIKDRIDEAIASLPESKTKELVEAYLRRISEEGEFDPYLGESPRPKQNPLKRRT